MTGKPFWLGTIAPGLPPGHAVLRQKKRKKKNHPAQNKVFFKAWAEVMVLRGSDSPNAWGILPQIQPGVTQEPDQTQESPAGIRRMF